MFTLASEHSLTSNIYFLCTCSTGAAISATAARNKQHLNRNILNSMQINFDAVKRLARMIPWTNAMENVA